MQIAGVVAEVYKNICTIQILAINKIQNSFYYNMLASQWNMMWKIIKRI